MCATVYVCVSVCMCVWAAEGLVATEILTYRAPLPAALSLASTSQRKRSAAAWLIYNLCLSFPPASVFLSFHCHCIPLSASKLQEFLFVMSTSSMNQPNSLNQLGFQTPFLSLSSPLILITLSFLCSHFLFLTILLPSFPPFTSFALPR